MRTLIPMLLFAAAALPAAAQPGPAPDPLNVIVQGERHSPVVGTLRSGAPPTRSYDLKYMRCEWDLDPDDHFISGSVTSWFTAMDNLQQVVFDLRHELTVDQVSHHGNNLSFTHGTDHLLTIDLPATLASGQLDSLTVTYHGVPPNTGFGSFITDTHEGVPVIWTLSEPYGAMDWWPCKQDLNDKIDSLDQYVTTPSIYRAAGHGLLVGSEVNGNETTWHWRHRYPIDYYLVATAVTNYAVDEQYAQLQNDSLLMLSYAYPEDATAVFAAATSLLPVITLYDQLFGTYPFANEKYGHAQFAWGGAMEHQTMSFMGSFHPEIMAHELAHQWFGDKVTCHSWADLWLNEGFATYLSGLSYEHLSPMYWPIWKRQKVYSITSEPDGSVFCTDTVDQNRLFSSRLTYNKGAMVVHMLRWVCGDSAFYAGMRNYLDDPTLAYGTATTANLQAHLEAASGLDLDGFFADWYTGEGYPSYTTVWSQEVNNLATITLSQTTSHPSVDFFEMPVPLRFFGGGADTTVVLNNLVNDEVFSVQLPFAIDSVQFDPDIWLVSAQNFVTRVDEADVAAPGVLLHPNPAGDRISWTLPGQGQVRAVRVFDAMGRQVLEGDARSRSLSLGSLAPGGYLLELHTDEGRYRSRFIKE